MEYYVRIYKTKAQYQFNGGECSKLLESINILEGLIKCASLEDDKFLDSIVRLFKYLREVNKKYY